MHSGELLRIIRDIDDCTSVVILAMEPVGKVGIPLKLLRELKVALRTNEAPSELPAGKDELEPPSGVFAGKDELK